MDPLRRSPYRPAAFASAATKGLTEDRTRSHVKEGQKLLAKRAATTEVPNDSCCAEAAGRGGRQRGSRRPALTEAIDYLRVVHSGRKCAGPPPTAFAPKAWQAPLNTADGGVDLTGYGLGILDELRRDIFQVHSLRYTDPRKGLL